MAEFAGLGPAGNIAQFVEFSIKLFGSGREIYRSATSNTVEDLEIETVTKDLKSISQDLFNRIRWKQVVTKDEEELRKLAIECEKLATKLLDGLDELKVKDEGGEDCNKRTRKYRSIKKALAPVMKGNEIQELEDQLERFQK